LSFLTLAASIPALWSKYPGLPVNIPAIRDVQASEILGGRADKPV
jgi:hypothetical protein